MIGRYLLIYITSDGFKFRSERKTPSRLELLVPALGKSLRRPPRQHLGPMFIPGIDVSRFHFQLVRIFYYLTRWRPR